jgi:hypothetical protein
LVDKSAFAFSRAACSLSIRPTMEKIGYRTGVFTFGGLGDRQEKTRR